MKKWIAKSFHLESTAKVVWLCCLVLAGGCTAVSSEAAREEPELIVFAAASLTDAFTELGQAFAAEEAPVSVTFNFAGSSQLVTQLHEGAVADIFASANEAQMAAAVAANRIQPGTVRPFAANRLSLIVPAENPAGIVSLADVAEPGVRLVLAVPGVPVRDYSDALIQTLDSELQSRLYANLVSEAQNVRQVVAQVVLGEADAAIVYQTDITPGVAASIRQIPLPGTLNIQALYPVAIVGEAPQPALAQAFIDFVLSLEGQAILAKWGFAPPPGE